jgi:hypothetical protein
VQYTAVPIRIGMARFVVLRADRIVHEEALGKIAALEQIVEVKY